MILSGLGCIWKTFGLKKWHQKYLFPVCRWVPTKQHLLQRSLLQIRQGPLIPQLGFDEETWAKWADSDWFLSHIHCTIWYSSIVTGMPFYDHVQRTWELNIPEWWAKFNTEKTCHINTSRLDNRLGEHQSRHCIRTNFQFFLLFEESTTSVG